MKKLLLFSLVLLFSCKTKTVIEPKKSLAEICRDSFPCKINSVSFVEHDTTYITDVKIFKKDSIQYVNTETVKEVVKIKTKVIDYKTSSEFVVLKDSLKLITDSNKSLSDTVLFYKNESLNKTKEFITLQNDSKLKVDNENSKFKKSLFVNIFLFLLVLLLAYLLGKKK